MLSSKLEQVLKAAEKLIQGQFSRKEKAQPNKSYQQGSYQQSGSDPAPRKRKDAEHQFAGKASSAKHKKGKQQLTFKNGGSSSDEYSSEDQPEYAAYLGLLRVSSTACDLAGTKSCREDKEPKPTLKHDGEKDVPEFFLCGSRHLLHSP